MPIVKTRVDSVELRSDEIEPTVIGLLADLTTLDPSVRRGAAQWLGKHPETARALGIAIETETVQSVRESIFTALMRIGTKLAAAGLVPLLQSEDVALRSGAVEALKTMPEFAAECLGEIFANVGDVRIFSLEILGGLPPPDRLYWLKRVVAEEHEINVCAVAVDVLVERGDHEAVGPLRQLLERFPDEPFLEFAIQSALARIEA